MNELILFSISILPVILLGMYIYKKDKNKEPSKLLIKLFLGGMLSTILVTIISLILYIIFPILSEETINLNLFELAIKAFIGVALIEEFCKWIMAYKIAYNDEAFDEIYDSILYCVFVALGFAAFENLLYVYEYGMSTGIARALLAVPGHACDGVFMGYYLGLAKLSSINNQDSLKKKYLIFSILVPTLLHGIYDYCLFTHKSIFLIIFLIFVISLYIQAVKRIKKLSNIDRKMKYKDNYCPNCGHAVSGNFCPICGRRNE